MKRSAPTIGLEPIWRHSLGDYLSAAAWSPEGTLVAAGSLAGDAVVLDGASGRVLTTLPTHEMGVLSLGWSHDGAHLAVGGQDGVAGIWSRADGRERVVASDGWVTCAAWSPRAALLALGSGRQVQVVGPDGEVAATFAGQASTVTAVVWSPDGRLVGVGCYGGVPWYEPGAGDRPKHRFAWKGSILTLAVAPDGSWLAAGNQDNSVHVWELWSGDDLEMTGYPAKVQHLAWDQTSRHLAVGNVGEITVWSFAGKGPRGSKPTFLEGHDRHISALCYQHQGRMLASGSADGRLALWATPKRTTPCEVVELGSEVSLAAWRPDDGALLVGSASGDVGVLGLG